MEREVKPMLKNELEVKTKGLLQADKAELNSIVKNAVNNVKDGNVNKLDAFIFAKKLELISKELVKELKPIAETVPINKGGLTMYNAELTETTQGAKWDYSECGDNVLDELVKQQEELKTAVENRQKFLKTITKVNTPVITEDGETYTVNPPVKSGALGLTVKLK